MRPVTIQTPSRLHFGLLGWGARALRQFGGLGLMIDEPGVIVRVEEAEKWEATGIHAVRALEVGQSVGLRLQALGMEAGPSRISVIRAPDEHVGLGVGTQLSMAVARA